MNNEALQTQIALLHNGDKVAFEELYQDLKTPVYTIIFRILYDRVLAEDIMQDVFLRLFHSPPDSQVQNPRAYIFRMARNLAIDSKRKPVQAALTDEIGNTGGSPEEAIILRLDIESKLRELSSDAREIITLHVNGELKFREIAEILNIPLGTILWKYQKALSCLRSKLTGGE